MPMHAVRRLPYQPTKVRCLSEGPPFDASPNWRSSSRMMILYPSPEFSCPTSQTSSCWSLTLPPQTDRAITDIFFGVTSACSRVTPWHYVVRRSSPACRRIISVTSSTVIAPPLSIMQPVGSEKIGNAGRRFLSGEACEIQLSDRRSVSRYDMGQELPYDYPHCPRGEHSDR